MVRTFRFEHGQVHWLILHPSITPRTARPVNVGLTIFHVCGFDEPTARIWKAEKFISKIIQNGPDLSLAVQRFEDLN